MTKSEVSIVKEFTIVLAYTDAEGNARVWFDIISCLTRNDGLETARENFAQQVGREATDFLVFAGRCGR